MPSTKRNHAHQGQPPPSVVVVVANVTGAIVVFCTIGRIEGCSAQRHLALGRCLK